MAVLVDVGGVQSTRLIFSIPIVEHKDAVMTRLLDKSEALRTAHWLGTQRRRLDKTVRQVRGTGHRALAWSTYPIHFPEDEKVRSLQSSSLETVAE